MIHLILGTKAQYIKTAPVVWRLQEQGIPFRIVDTGQHAAWTASLRQTLRIPQPAISLRVGGNLSGVRAGLWWLSRWLGRARLSPGWIYSRIFSGRPGLALVHGDTASAWLGACLARRAGLAAGAAGLRLAHLEAGLSSENFLSPFPEEWFRQRTSRMADLLLAPSDWAAGNLKRMRVRGKIVSLGANTGLEAVRFSLSLPPNGEDAPPAGRYGVAAIHRMETLYSARRMEFVVSAVAQAARGRRMIFILHEPTERALRRFRLAGRLAGLRHGVELKPLLSHAAFLRLLAGAEIVLSDGGSVQEEAFYLNVPCLILRDRTERLEGLQPPANVCLARWNRANVEEFLRAPDAWRGAGFAGPASPSAEAVKAMREFDSGGFGGMG